MRYFVAFLAAACLAAAIGAPAPAAAHEWRGHRNYDHHWRHEPHFGMFFGLGEPFFYPDWPPPVVIYRTVPPPAVVYAPPPPVQVSPPPVHAVPTSPDYTDSEGRTCREFRTTVRIGGSQQPSYGTACQDANGSWRIVP